MNAKQLIVLTFAMPAALIGSAAFAQEATSDAWMKAASTQSRAEVQADIAKAGVSSTPIGGGEATVFSTRPAVSTKSREAVRAEARTSARKMIDAAYVGA